MNEASTNVDLPVADEGHRLDIKGLLVGLVMGLPQLFFPIVAVVFGTRSQNNPVLIPIAIAVVLLVSVLFRWIGWMRFLYYIGEHDVRIESGVLNRTARSIPYERIQDVSIEQKLLPRLFGLGEVKFETINKKHRFDVQVFFNTLDPDFVQVELFANGKDVNGFASRTLFALPERMV